VELYAYNHTEALHVMLHYAYRTYVQASRQTFISKSRRKDITEENPRTDRYHHVRSQVRLYPLWCTVTKANQNEALLWNIAVLGMEKSPDGAGKFCSSPMLVFYIPEPSSGMGECKIPAWERDKMLRHQQGDISFPELQFSMG
jgi:hypothetical protein